MRREIKLVRIKGDQFALTLLNNREVLRAYKIVLTSFDKLRLDIPSQETEQDIRDRLKRDW